MPSRHRPIRAGRRAVLVAAVAVGAGVAGACDRDGGGGDTAAFCAQVSEHEAALFDPMAVPTRESTEDLIDLWEEVGEDAPLAIETHWAAYVLSLETALDADEQEALARAYATEQSGVAIATWLDANCAITLAVATIVPQATAIPPGSGASLATLPGG